MFRRCLGDQLDHLTELGDQLDHLAECLYWLVLLCLVSPSHVLLSHAELDIMTRRSRKCHIVFILEIRNFEDMDVYSILARGGFR